MVQLVSGWYANNSAYHVQFFVVVLLYWHKNSLVYSLLRTAGLHKAGIPCILDTRQIDPLQAASIQKIDKSNWAEGPVCNKQDHQRVMVDPMLLIV